MKRIVIWECLSRKRDDVMKLLLHACCGPCACYPAEKLLVDGKAFDSLYFKKRYKLIVDKSYPLETCVRGMLDEPVIRCAYCYRVRMRYAAQYAKENGYDAFSTTLLVSPYQKHELIIQMAEEAGKEFDIPFYYEDFRKGYQRGVDISLELELYRQPYCGCVFSERDRYEKKPKVKLD